MSKAAEAIAALGLLAGSHEPEFRRTSHGYAIRRRDGHIIGPMYAGSKKFTRSQRKGRGASDKGSHLHAGFKRRERNRKRRARNERVRAEALRAHAFMEGQAPGMARITVNRLEARRKSGGKDARPVATMDDIYRMAEFAERHGEPVSRHNFDGKPII